MGRISHLHATGAYENDLLCSQSSHFPWRGASRCETHGKRAEAQLPHRLRYSTIREKDEQRGTTWKKAVEQRIQGDDHGRVSRVTRPASGNEVLYPFFLTCADPATSLA